MEMTIEKLTIKREKLLNQKIASNQNYAKKISQIDKAIKKFLEGMAMLNEKRSATSEIENILADGKPLHVSAITEELERRGFTIVRQSVSGILQTYSKSANKKFKRTAPATFALSLNNQAQAMPAGKTSNFR